MDKIEQILSIKPSDKFHIKTLAKGKQIIVYGAGAGLGPLYASVFDRTGIKPSLIIDKKFDTPSSLDSVSCCSLSDCKLSQAQKDSSLVIVSVGDFDAFDAIQAELKRAGFLHIIKASQIYEYAIHHEPEGFSYDSNEFFTAKKAQILKAYSLLEDKDSKDIYASLLKTYISHEAERIKFDPPELQYLFRSEKFLPDYSDFVCCGAYDGDSIRALQKQGIKPESIICFEPDLQNFTKLTQYIKASQSIIANDILCLPIGVHSTSTSFKFSGKNGLCSGISQDGNDTIICAKLDEVLTKRRVSFVSLDVEGSELETLKGALEIIKSQKPSLAISIYHYPNHLWEILLWLDGLGLGYKFFIRNYTGHSYESVLYAGV